MEPTASLAVLIYNFSKSPFENQKVPGLRHWFWFWWCSA
jgi:hypothetical protein